MAATTGPAMHLTAKVDYAIRAMVELWIALRANMRAVLEAVSLADVARDELPTDILRLAEGPAAREQH